MHLQGTKDKKVKSGSGRRSAVKSGTRSGRYCGSSIPKGKCTDIALDATIRAAAPHQLHRGRSDEALVIEKSDLRQKLRSKKVGNTIVFLVDSSGSMGASRRMTETKGAVLSLLMDAYQKRDRVGLVAFKGNSAEILLQPTSSVELAKKHLDVLPTGGKTPFSKGLLKAYDLIKNELKRNKEIKPLLVIISDGRANVSINDNDEAFAEVLDIARAVKKDNIDSLVIDTESGFIRLSRLHELADVLGGNYFLLENLKAEALSRLVRKSVEE